MIEVRSLVVEVDSKIVVDKVNLSINDGEIVVVMGPNGSGKTSLLYAIAGHPSYRVISGEVIIDGIDYTDKPAYQRALAGLFLVFQNPVELPGVSLETLLRSALNKRLGKSDLSESIMGLPERIRTEAKLLGLKEDLVTRDLNIGFSGGEKKRSEILQARIIRPKYLLLDEPDSGLDVDGVRMIADYIREVVDYGGGVLLVSHNPELIKRINPSMIHVMNRGRIVASGGLELVEKVASEGYNWLR